VRGGFVFTCNNLAKKITDDSTAIHCTEICLSYFKVIRNLTHTVVFPRLSTNSSQQWVFTFCAHCRHWRYAYLSCHTWY